nr:GNAT family N-acetyltransferase [Micrococcus terreus]MDK7702271.1 GNAT family N-acetyltransferase [Micrococcus terreus]
MTPFDLPEVLELEQQLFPLEAWPLEFYLEELAQAGPAGGMDVQGRPATRDYRVVVREGSGGAEADAGRDGEIVGYGGLMVAGDLADVQTIGVVPGARGLGLGGAQLRWMIAEARGRGAEALLLEVRADNVGAQALYTRHGFEHIHTRRGYYPGEPDAAGRVRPVDALIMRLPLTEPDHDSANWGSARRVAPSSAHVIRGGGEAVDKPSRPSSGWATLG